MVKQLNGYERFYQIVFGKHFEDMVLPEDYKETVLYILNGRGVVSRQARIDPEWATIVMRWLGIGDYSVPEPMTDIALRMGMEYARVAYRKDGVFRKCRCWYKTFLEMGLTKYKEG